MSQFYIVDLRPEWSRNPYITFWRPDCAGYAYPLPWAGKYSREEVERRGEYLTTKGYKGRYFIRFAVLCETVELLAEQPKPGVIDHNTGPVVVNNGKIRSFLRRHRYVLRGLQAEAA